jgi:DNA helicase HerA-like ATPase
MPSSFYLGRIFDLTAGKLSKDKVLYDPADLTTHAVVTGMTGSGKTGLCIGLMEEAALEQIPALIIDPKGDLTNLLLHFPELLPSDFAVVGCGDGQATGKNHRGCFCRNRQFMEKRAGRMGNHA